jgi:MFS family permease
MCSLQPISGKMYSIFSQKTTFLTYFALFMFGSLLCGASVSSNMFIVGRAVAGSGAAGVLSGTLSIISVITSLDKQALYVGLLMSLVGTAVVLGPIIGGALTESATWRWCFYLNLPCGAGTFLALLLFFRPPERQNKTPLTLVQKVLKLDLIGCFLFVPAIIMILLALQWGGGNFSWNSSTIIGLFCGAGVTFIVFLFWEYRQGDAAMLPLSLLTNLSIISSCLYGLFLLGAYVAVGYYLPEWFQIVKGASPEHSAVMLLPNIISNFIFKALCGIISKFCQILSLCYSKVLKPPCS